MKKLITICFFIITAFSCVNGQNKLSGSLGTYAHNNICNKYTNLNWEVRYKFEKRTDGIYLTYYNPKITIAQNSLYATAEKNYLKSELGLSVWPESYSPSSLNVSVNCRMPNGKVELSGFAFSTSDPYKPNEDWVCGTTFNGQEANLSAFTLSVTKASYSPQSVRELDNIIIQKKSQTTNTSTTTTQNSGSSNPSGTSQTSTSETTSQIPSLESQYAKLGIPANTPTYTKQEVTNQLVTQGVGLVAGILTELGEEKRQKEAYQAQLREAQAERERAAAQIRREKIATHTNFITAFIDAKLPLSSSNIEEDVIYYFAFSADKSALATTNPTINITEIFPITKYNDDTWPFSVNIKKEISNILKSTDIVLIGYYKSKTEAETDYFKFKNSLEKLNFLITSYNYKGKIKESNSNDDMWDDTSKKTTNDVDDFWGESKKEEKGKNTKTQSTPVNKTPIKKETPKTKTDDFWDN